MSRRKRWRFALQVVDGPNTGLGAGSWRVWAHRDEVYVAPADLAATIKVSLHQSGKWRVAYTAEHMAQDKPLWNPSADRAAWKFDPPPFINGVQHAFVVAAVRGAFRPFDADPRETIVPLEDRWDRVAGVRVIITEPHIAVKGGLVFDDPLQLANGKLVWLERLSEAITPCEPEPVPVAQMVRYMSPDSQDISSPGYLLVGVTVA